MDCISPVFVRKHFQHFPCGQCNFCLQSRRMDWVFRLQWEKKKSTTSHFITLTYDESNVPLGRDDQPTLVPSDLTYFLKRLRAVDARHAGLNSGIRFYGVGEYGERKGRPHYHLLVFNAKQTTIRELPKIWSLGHVDVGEVTGASICYVAGYTFSRRDHPGDVERPFAMMSRRPGIGADYLRTNRQYHKLEGGPQVDQRFTVVAEDGKSQRIPRYFKTKIFTEGDRDAYNERLKKERERLYSEAIVLLKRYTDDPHGYYNRALAEHHERLGRQNKKLLNNKI